MVRGDSYVVDQDPQFKSFKVREDEQQSHINMSPPSPMLAYYTVSAGGWWLVAGDRRPDLRHSGHAFPFPFLPATTTAMPSHTLDGSLELEY